MYQKIRNKFRERPTLFYACSIVASWAGVGSLMNFRTIALNYGAVPAIIWAVFNSLACILFGLFVDRVPSIRRIMQSKVMFYFIGLLTLFQTWTQMSGIPLDGQTPENGLSAAEMNHAAEADAMLADYTAVISPRAVDAMGSFAAQNAKPAAEAVQAESAKSSTTTQLQPMSLSPVFQISGMQDSQQLRSALNQSVEDMRQMILDVVQSARDDEERMNFS